MATNTLTDARCKSAKPGPKLVKLFDGGGLHLAITPKAAKVWRLAYRIGGVPQTMSLGPYPEVTLAAARAARDEQKVKLRAGEDPMAPRRAVRGGKTLQEACTTYWATRGDLSEQYRTNIRRAMEMHVYPKLGARAPASIGRVELMTVLNPMDDKGLHSYVRKVRMWLSQVFDWLVEHEEMKINPAALIDTRKAFGHTEVEHFPAITPAEVPTFLQRLSLEGELQSVLACRLLAYTWVRTKELRFMKWPEWEEDVWRVPGGHMKNRKPHLVPLPRQAVAVLQEMRRRAPPGADYVFVAEHRNDRPMSENAVLALLYRIGYKGRMSGHGWRSTGSTWANEAGYSADVVERQLAHSPADKTRAAYNRATHMPERRAMLQAWADWLDVQGAG